MGAGRQRGSRTSLSHTPFPVRPRSVFTRIRRPRAHAPLPRAPVTALVTAPLCPLTARRRQRRSPSGRAGTHPPWPSPRAQRINPRARPAEMRARAHTLPLPPAETRRGANGCPAWRAQPVRMPSAVWSLALAAVAGPAPHSQNAGWPARVRRGTWASHVRRLRAGGSPRALGAAGLVRPRPRTARAPPVRQRPSEGPRLPPLLLHAQTAFLIAAVTLWPNKQPELCH